MAALPDDQLNAGSALRASDSDRGGATETPVRSAAPRVALTLAFATLLHASLAALPTQARAQEVVRPTTTFTQLVPGMLARVRHQPTSSGVYVVQVWDLLVGPGIQSDAATLPGAAVLEVRAGSGTLTFAAEEVALRPGTMVSVPEGASVRVRNGDDVQGLSFRAYLVRARAP